MSTPLIHIDPNEWTPEVHRAFINLIAARLRVEPTRFHILNRIQALTQPGSVRLRYVEICPDCAVCRDVLPGGCNCCFEDMHPLDVEDDGQVLGDEGVAKFCCQNAFVAVRCDSCRAEAARYEKADDDCHALREDR